MTQFTLPSELGTIEDLTKRFDDAVTERNRTDPSLSLCFKYLVPSRNTFFGNTPTKDTLKDVYDLTGPRSLRRYVSKLIETLMPAWREWSLLEPGTTFKDQAAESQVAKFLEEQTHEIFRDLNQSAFYQALPEAGREMGVSTGVLRIDAGDFFNPYRCSAEPLSSVYLEEGPFNTIENVWRKPDMKARLIEREYDGAQLSVELQDKITDNANAKAELIEGTLYAPKDDVYVQFLIEAKTKHLAWSQYLGSGPGASPWIVFRDDKIPGETLGRGPGMIAIHDVMVLNKMREMGLRNIALHVLGLYTGISDGVLNPHTQTLIPGLIMPVASNARANPSLQALQRSGDFNAGEISAERLEMSIRETFLDNLRRFDDPVKTATREVLDNEDVVRQEAANFGRLQTELVNQVMQRAVRIRTDLGLAPVLRVDGREVNIKPTSPLARIQDRADVNALSDAIHTSNQLVGPEVTAAGLAIEKVPEWLANKMGVSEQLIRDESERGEIEEMFKNMVQAQAESSDAGATA